MPIDIDLEDSEPAADWSDTGLALPVDYGPTPRLTEPGTSRAAFGKVAPASRSERGAPYSTSSELADAAASVQAAEALLALPPPPLATSGPSGGVAVKHEGASA